MLELLRVSRRPRRSYASERVRAFSKCPCGGADLPTLAASVFEALDMPHAAAMHAALLAEHLVDWTARDWSLHLAEEEDALFPALRAAGADETEIEALEKDHAFYKPILKGQTGPALELPSGKMAHSIDAHAALEDRLIRTFASKILARAGASVGASSSSFDYAALAASMNEASAADAAARDKRKKEADAKLDDWGKAVDTVVPGGGSWLAGTSKLALGIEGAVVRWAQGDWNSDGQKQRALNDAKESIDRGMPPRQFDAEIDFAKTYADSLEQDMARASELGHPWRAVFEDYVATLQANAHNPLVVSAFVRATGSFSQEFGAPSLCEALAAVTGTKNEQSGPPPFGRDYHLANLLAVLATARFGTPLEPNLRRAYEALPALLSVHPSICSGRGYKGDADSWDYDHGPVLYVLQAWLALSPKPHADALVSDPKIAAKDPWAKTFTTASSSSPLLKTAIFLGGLGALVFVARALL